MQSRRDFLKKAAMLSGGVGLLGAMPESVQRAFAIEPTPGTTYLDAEHIVILMQENRSFDHVFGTLQGVRGFNDPRALRLENQNSVFLQTNAAGETYTPWRLDIKDTRATWMGSIPHSRQSQVDAWNYGHYNGWLDAKRSSRAEYKQVPLTMGHYTREDLPFYYALADAFTVCDQHFCGAMTSTTPNRCLFWTGTVREQQDTNSRVFIRNEEIDSTGMTWGTFPERLQEAGISWKFYQNDLTYSSGMSPEEGAWLGNFGCNILEFFANYNVQATVTAGTKIKNRLTSLNRQLTDLQAELVRLHSDPSASAEVAARIDAKKAQIATTAATLKKAGPTDFAKLSPEQQALHKAAFATNAGDPAYRSIEAIQFEDGGKKSQMNVPKGDILHQFREDVNSGNLPKVSWLAAPEKFSDHPTSPWYGAWYVSEVMDILTKNPEVWKKTIFIMTYDENDGYFDHAPSFVAADPKRRETGRASAGIDTGLEYMYASDELRQGVPSGESRNGPIGLGFRVPMIVASPWSRGGWVNSQLFEHTSTLMFLEGFIKDKYGKQIFETNISPWRRAISGNLTSVFRPYDGDKTKLPFMDRDKSVVGIQKARYKEIPAGYRKLTPEQVASVNQDHLHSEFTSHQEKGVRPSCALPYELYADGMLNPDGKGFQIHMQAGNSVHGAKSMGAPFNVYVRNMRANSATQKKSVLDGNMSVATYTVKSGDTLRQAFPLALFIDGKYEVDVHGPNGFYRSFRGNAIEPTPMVHIGYEQKESVLSGNVKVEIQNTSAESMSVDVIDNSYKTGKKSKRIAPGGNAIVVVDSDKSHGWYDFTVKAAGSQAEYRFAGRVETGKSSYSDPVMGGLA